MKPNEKLENLESFIQSEAKNLSEIFLNISLQNSINSFHFPIDETKLNSDYSDKINITTHGDFKKIFEKLRDFEEYPALYVFQINPSIPKNEISSLIKHVNDTHQLNIPAKNSAKDNSGVLYVGKVTKCFWGRLIQHLGYHKNRKSHGLQIDYWINKIPNPQLSITVFFLNKDVKDHISVLERIMAKSLNPIIGKH